MSATVATVAGLWRHPVKSMQGEAVDAGTLGPLGLDGDRIWAVRSAETGHVLTAKRHGALLEAAAATRPDGSVEVTLPDGRGRFVAGDDALDAALSAWLGQPCHLARAQPDDAPTFEMSFDAEHPDQDLFEWPVAAGTFQDLAAAHLLTTTSLRTAAALGPDSDWDVRRFRPTVLLEAVEAAAPDGAEGFPEDAWVGHQITIGAARLEVAMTTIRCPMPVRAQPGGLPRDTRVAATLRDHHESTLGVYAQVTAPGRVAVGDPATLAA